MNKNTYIIVFIGIIIFQSILLICCTNALEKEQNKVLNAQNELQKEEEVRFIWNDDLESLPKDGALIKIDFTDGNDVFLTNQ